jgi:hypothetical protein
VSSMAVDDDQFLDHLVKMICDPSSSSFVLRGVGLDGLRVILNEHGIQPHMSVDLCRQALCHHILNGLCGKADGEQCRPIVGRYHPCAVAQHLSSALLDIISNPNFPLDVIRTICAGLGYHYSGVGERQYLKYEVQKRHSQLLTHSVNAPVDFFKRFERATKQELLAHAGAHGLTCSGSTDEIRTLLAGHFTRGECSKNAPVMEACSDVRDAAQSEGGTSDDIQAYILTAASYNISRKRVLALLRTQGVEFDSSASLSKLRKVLRRHARSLQKGKHVPIRSAYQEIRHGAKDVEREAQLNRTRNQWPQLVPKELKAKISRMFREETSSEALREKTCGCCAESVPVNECEVLPTASVNLELLKRPDSGAKEAEPGNVGVCYIDPDCVAPDFPSFDGIDSNVMLEPAGVLGANDDEQTCVQLCKRCSRSLARNKLPQFALANRMFLGNCPPELKDLTFIEESIISLCRAKLYLIQMRTDEGNDDIMPSNMQRGLRGHVIIFPQSPQTVAKKLPPEIDDIVTPVCVLFIGSKPPTREWLNKKATLLTARADRIRSALVWLKAHNPLYKDIELNEAVIKEIHRTPVLPFHVQHVLPSDAQDVLQSRYDNCEETPIVSANVATAESQEGEKDCESTREIPFEKVVITDIHGHASSNELLAAAVRHVKKKGGSYIEIGHESLPVNEFDNTILFPMIYPTLYPYGIGGFEDRSRTVSASMKAHVKHLFSLADRRFQQHHSFLFTAFNMLQRRAVLLHTSLKVKKNSFESVVARFGTVSADAVHRVSERVAHGDYATAYDDEEKRVLTLMKEVNVVTSHVPGSSSARLMMRNEIRGLMIRLGLPSFYLTLNPGDVFNPVVKLLAGANIDVDHLLQEDVPKFWEQSVLVAKNPFVAAKFFNVYMKAFIKSLLGYDPHSESLEGGILGLVKGYYGCVETQGRGTLHCHMLVWVEGGLDPNQIRERVLDPNEDNFRDRLLAFLDDTISSCVPSDPDPKMEVPSSKFHPGSVRGLNKQSEGSEKEWAKDLYHVVSCSQIHSHKKTCFKYWKGPQGSKPECRFGLDPNLYQPVSSIDGETGDLCLRCLDGMVNNFNATIIQTMRCNMDIKFIGSGSAAKAIMYYITNYISKPELKTNVAYAALELAVQKLGEYHPEEDMLTTRAKQMLQKCCHAMISHQEMPAQAVALHLMDYGDRYTSHEFRRLYWTSFENHVNLEFPSPECYKTVRESGEADPENTKGDAVNEVESVEENNEACHDEDVEAQVVDEHGVDHLDEDRLDMDSDGVLLKRSSYVMDYTCRGSFLGNMNLWDFMSDIEKVKKSDKKKVPMTADAAVDEDVDDEEGNPSAEIGSIDTQSLQRALDSETRARPVINLESAHHDSETHALSIRHPSTRPVIVPIGPGIPRRDNEECYDRYCRLMLIFFKPWRNVSDLRESFENWTEAFAHFMSCDSSKPARTTMDHMQILHECKDCQADHFRQQKSRYRNLNISPEIQAVRISEKDGLAEFVDEQEILSHIEAVDACHSRSQDNVSKNVLPCLFHARQSGIFTDQCEGSIVDGELSEDADCMLTESCNLEDEWDESYADRRIQNKKRHCLRPQDVTTVPQSSVGTSIQDGNAFRNAQGSVEPATVRITEDIDVTDQERVVDVNDVIKRWCLNKEQERAFRIVVTQSFDVYEDSLRMFLGGAAGTGKSRVINAIRDYFEQRGQTRRFRVCSYMGIAARNVRGMTLHAALGINHANSNQGPSQSDRDLAAMWCGVDFLFIDEVSMISCRFLCQISERLSIAKGNSSAFGGINIIFAGDFAQLPPVRETKLFARIKHTFNASSKLGQSIVLGKLLWLSVKTVVILYKQHRQMGSENSTFVALLSRLREGRCTDADYRLLQSRILTPEKYREDAKWTRAPIIVSDNATKDALNEKCAVHWARQMNKTVHWYYPVDKHNRDSLQDPDLVQRLRSIHSGTTRGRLGRLPLFIGMPVLVSQNFDVEGGIVNGSYGIVRYIRYHLNEVGERHLRSCVVEIDDACPDPMPQLLAGNCPIMADTTKITYTHPFSKRSCSFARTQVPIVPAYAVTAHRAQGQSMEKVIVDLESCQGTEAPYVMVSRATSLEGVLILRPFHQKRITCALSQDARAEKTRLHRLSLQTLVKFGDADESKQAQFELLTMGLDCPIQTSFIPYSDRPEEPFALLQRLQKQDLRIHEAHPNHASYLSSTGQLVSCASKESPEDLLIPSGNFITRDEIYNLCYLRIVSVDEEVWESRPTNRIHKKPYFQMVPLRDDNATAAATCDDHPMNIRHSIERMIELSVFYSNP